MLNAKIAAATAKTMASNSAGHTPRPAVAASDPTMAAEMGALGAVAGALAGAEDALLVAFVDGLAEGTELAATVTIWPTKLPVKENVAVAPLNAPPTMVAVHDIV